MNVKKIDCPLCLLGEGPVWNNKERTIYWLDILNNRIYKKKETSDETILLHETNSNVGGLAFYENGDLLAFVKEGAIRLTIDDNGKSESEDLIYSVELDEDERYNDIIVDPKGRVFAGTLKSTNKDGKLILFEKGKTPKVILTGLGISNGMGFSPCEKYFYHTDSMQKKIMRYEYDIKTGNISNSALLYEAKEIDGVPDGMTVDTKGDLWIACWGGCQVIHIDSKGNIVERISIDANQVSSVAFGDNDLDSLYVTTAGVGADDEITFTNVDGSFMGGKLYKFLTQTRGKQDFYADI